jgi:hypothetical protein
MFECLLGLGHRIFGLQPSSCQFLPQQQRLAIVLGGISENLLPHREPAVGRIVSGLGNAKSILLVFLLMLSNRSANRFTKPGDVGRIAGQFLGLVAVGQRRLEPTSLQILPAALNERPRESADEPLTVTVTPDVIGLGDLEGLVKPVVGQRTLGLFDSQDQHCKAPFRYGCR